MKSFFSYFSLTMIVILALCGNPYALYSTLDHSLRANLYLDRIDQDEDLFIFVQKGKNALDQPLIHHEESNKESGSKSKLLKTKLYLFFSVFKFVYSASFKSNFTDNSRNSTPQDIAVLIFHPPNLFV